MILYAYVANGGTLGELTATITYGYEAENQTWADQLTSYNGEAIRYDANGNPTTYRGYTMTWQGRRLTGATDGTTTTAYTYDENGLRTQKTVNGTATQYRYHGSVLISQVSGNDKLLFSYDANGNAVAVNYNGTYYYYVRNGQNDVIRLIDGNNNTVVEYTYDSWGKLLSTTGTLATTLGAQNPFRYRGYAYDSETGYYYLQTRYYDAEVGRFINADVYVSTGQDVLGHNMYAYCENNPVVRMDDEGELWAGILILIGITAFVSTSTGCKSGGNCYTYAVGTKTSFDGGCYYPGYCHGLNEDKPFHNALDLVSEVQYDMDCCWGTGAYTIRASNDTEIPDENSWKVAYCYSEELKDFHFYRFDNDKGWSHKMGSTPVRSTDESGNAIVDLKSADRGKYNSALLYLMITKNK